MTRVTMLWEDTDPDVALRTRFGFDSGADCARWVASVLAQLWGIGGCRCESLVLSDHNALAWCSTAQGRVIAKWSVDPSWFERLTDAANVTDWLAGHGVPVSRPVRALDGRLQVVVDSASMCVQQVIAGEMLDVDDLASVRAAGETLARLHLALAQCPVPTLSTTAPTEPMGAQIRGWLEHAPENVPDRSRQLLAQLLPDEALAGDLQVVQGDYRAANILTGSDGIKAVLDFEELRLDHPVCELARSSVLIGTKFHDWGPVSSEVREVLFEGYRARRPLSEHEERWLDALVLWWSLLMIPATGDDPTGWRAAAEGITAR